MELEHAEGVAVFVQAQPHQVGDRQGGGQNGQGWRSGLGDQVGLVPLCVAGDSNALDHHFGFCKRKRHCDLCGEVFVDVRAVGINSGFAKVVGDAKEDFIGPGLFRAPERVPFNGAACAQPMLF